MRWRAAPLRAGVRWASSSYTRGLVPASDVNWLVDLRSEATLHAVVTLPIGRGPLQLVAIPAASPRRWLRRPPGPAELAHHLAELVQRRLGVLPPIERTIAMVVTTMDLLELLRKAGGEPQATRSTCRACPPIW